MKRTNLTLLAASALMAAAVPATAQTASKADAVALADKAAAHIQKKGIGDACKDFADARGGFIQGELYVFVHDANATMTCHGTNAKLNGKAMADLKDADGKYFVRDMRDRAMSGRNGWVDYIWVNPVTKALEPKSSYVRQADSQYWVGVGIYLKK